MPIGEGVRGIADAKVAVLTGDSPGANTDIVGVKSLVAEVTADSDEQRGDDAVLMVVQENKSLEVTLSSAYANLAALGVFTGYAPIASGTTPNVITTWKDPAAPNTSYVQVIGQARGRDANNSALRLTLLKLQMTGGPNWDMGEGAWLEPELTLTGVGRGTPSYLYEVAAYETLVALT
jgi:hypothetical protein